MKDVRFNSATGYTRKHVLSVRFVIFSAEYAHDVALHDSVCFVIVDSVTTLNRRGIVPRIVSDNHSNTNKLKRTCAHMFPRDMPLKCQSNTPVAFLKILST